MQRPESGKAKGRIRMSLIQSDSSSSSQRIATYLQCFGCHRTLGSARERPFKCLQSCGGEIEQTGRSPVTCGTTKALTLCLLSGAQVDDIVNRVTDCFPSLCCRPAMPQILAFWQYRHKCYDLARLRTQKRTSLDYSCRGFDHGLAGHQSGH